MRKNKVLFVSEYFYPKINGGGEISCYLLAKYLVNVGWEVSVLTSHFDKLKKYEKKDGMEIIRILKTGKNVSSIFSNMKRSFYKKSLNNKLNKILSEKHFDVVHFFNITSLTGAHIAKKFKNKIVAHINSPVIFDPIGILFMDKFKGYSSFTDTMKKVITAKYIGKFKNYFFLRFNPLFWLIVHHRYKSLMDSLNCCDLITPISEDAKDKLLKLGFDNSSIHVIPNIFEMKKMKKMKTKKKNLVKILYLGAYDNFKGPLVLLKALNMLEIPFHSNFYGKGKLKGDMQKYVDCNSLKNIDIHDFISQKNVEKVILEHDILVIPSIYFEAFGRVALEAMCFGKIVIASEIGGLKNVIKNNQNGILVEPNNSKAIAKAILNISSNADFSNKISYNARKAAKKYEGKKVARSLIKFYEANNKNE